MLEKFAVLKKTHKTNLEVGEISLHISSFAPMVVLDSSDILYLDVVVASLELNGSV